MAMRQHLPGENERGKDAMSPLPDPTREPSHAGDRVEQDPLDRLNDGLTQWERELLAEPSTQGRPRAPHLGRYKDLLDASRSVTRTLDPNELLLRVVDAVIRIAGAGRIIEMDITRIGKALRGDELERNPALGEAFAAAAKPGCAPRIASPARAGTTTPKATRWRKRSSKRTARFWKTASWIPKIGNCHRNRMPLTQPSSKP